MSEGEQANETSKLDGLELRMKMRSGEYCVARAGATLVLYYAKPMRELSAAISRVLDLYFAFIPEGVICSALSTTGVWRSFTKQTLGAALRRLNAEGVEYRSIHLSSGQPAHVGDYGFHFFGSNFVNADLWPRETCACVLEFPAAALTGTGKAAFLQFAAAVADVEPFESGYGGYAFKHLSETWRDQALPWIAQQAQRYLGLDISYDGFRRAARGRVSNVSWVTLLGPSVMQELGTVSQIAAQLPPQVEITPLQNGLMLVAGDGPPLGDVNDGAADLEWVKAVAALTRPVRTRMEPGFGSGRFRHGWLGRLD